MSNKLQLLKLIVQYFPQILRLTYVIVSMLFVLRLMDLEPDERLKAIEMIFLLIGGVSAIGDIKGLFSNDIVDSD